MLLHWLLGDKLPSVRHLNDQLNFSIIPEKLHLYGYRLSQPTINLTKIKKGFECVERLLLKIYNIPKTDTTVLYHYLNYGQTQTALLQLKKIMNDSSWRPSGLFEMAIWLKLCYLTQHPDIKTIQMKEVLVGTDKWFEFIFVKPHIDGFVFAGLLLPMSGKSIPNVFHLILNEEITLLTKTEKMEVEIHALLNQFMENYCIEPGYLKPNRFM